MKAKKFRSEAKAFTLIELLVVTVMLSIVCLAIYSTFSSGARIWQRVNRLSSAEDVAMFFDRFTSDVKNSFMFTGLKFQGRQGSFDLPTLVSSAGLGAKAPGLAMYSCTPDAVTRSQADYSQLYQGSMMPPRHVLGGLRSCKFFYYQYDEEKKEYSWVDEWARDDLPLAIRMALSIGTDENARELVKTVSIPVAGKKDKNEQAQ